VHTVVFIVELRIANFNKIVARIEKPQRFWK
jgi:hypothetical protein